MDLEFSLGCGPIDEKKLAASGKLPEGWFLARVKDIYADEAHDCYKIEYEIASGSYEGRTISDTLWDPRVESDDKRRQQKDDRLKVITKRIGAREDGSDQVNFNRALNRTVVIHLEYKKNAVCQKCGNEADKDRPKRNQCGNPSCAGPVKWIKDTDGFANLTMFGVYPPEHEDIPADVRKQLGMDGGAATAASNGHSAPPASRPATQPTLEEAIADF